MPDLLEPATLSLLRCPRTGEALVRKDMALVSESGQHQYPVNAQGIPLFADEYCSEDARRQQQHYDAVAEGYLENLGFPHTRVYSDYLHRKLLEACGQTSLGQMAELCCGRGDAIELVAGRYSFGLGLDVSEAMLTRAVRDSGEKACLFVQGDATRLPLASASFDSVVMLGGIHHVPDRQAVFGEVERVLKPGGRFLWREPANDFFLWRWLRAVIYLLSPRLDAQTEAPLRYAETAPLLERAGLQLESWKTYGFIGFCLFMNSDVLVFNGLFRFIPGIRWLTRCWTGIDDLMGRLPGLRRAGLQVVGVATKPAGSR